jgi:hypothetical protein
VSFCTIGGGIAVKGAFGAGCPIVPILPRHLHRVEQKADLKPISLQTEKQLTHGAQFNGAKSGVLGQVRKLMFFWYV